MGCLSALTIDKAASPVSSNMPFDRVLLANIDRCQQDLKWDHLPDDIWTDDIERWLDETSQQAVELHSAPKTCTYPSWPLPALNLFTDIQWQRPIEEYSPSIYSQRSSAISPGHLTNAARNPMQEMPLSPTQDIEMIDILDILDIAANIAGVCIEIRATVNRAEDSAEFDDSNSDSDSDVSMLDLADPLPIPATRFYDVARDRDLTIPDSSLSSSDGGSNHSSIDRRQQRSNAPSPSQPSQTSSPQSSATSTSYVHVRPLPRTRRHNISPDILSRMAQLLHFSVHDFALPTDENLVKCEM
jgi:hypothetical protein